MSTVPALTSQTAETMTPGLFPVHHAADLSADRLYEVVDGQVVEKRMSARLRSPLFWSGC